MKKFKLFVLDTALAGVLKFEKFFGFMDKFVREIIPNTAVSIITPFKEFTRVGGVLDKFKHGFFAIIEGLVDTVDLLTNPALRMIGRSPLRGLIEDMKKQREAAAARVMHGEMFTPEAIREIYGGDKPLKDQISEAMVSAGEKGKQSETYKELLEMRENADKEKPLREKSAKALEEINRKTPEIKTQSEFLDETANMLGRSIEGILGIGRDSTAAEMLEELKIANEQRAAQEAKSPAEYINTGN